LEVAVQEGQRRIMGSAVLTQYFLQLLRLAVAMVMDMLFPVLREAMVALEVVDTED
jgi:hypothetical protein